MGKQESGRRAAKFKGSLWKQIDALPGFDDVKSLLRGAQYQAVIDDFDKNDARANQWAGFYRMSTRLAVYLVLASAVLSAAGGLLPSFLSDTSASGLADNASIAVLTPLSVLLLALAVLILLSLHLSGAHGRWLCYRAKAENLRHKPFRMLVAGQGTSGSSPESSLLARFEFVHAALVVSQIAYNKNKLKLLSSDSSRLRRLLDAILGTLSIIAFLLAFLFSGLWLLDQLGATLSIFLWQHLR